MAGIPRLPYKRPPTWQNLQHVTADQAIQMVAMQERWDKLLIQTCVDVIAQDYQKLAIKVKESRDVLNLNIDSHCQPAMMKLGVNNFSVVNINK